MYGTLAVVTQQQSVYWRKISLISLNRHTIKQYSQSLWILKIWWCWAQKKWTTLLTGVSYWDEYFWNMLPHSSSWGNQRSNVTSVHLQCIFHCVGHFVPSSISSPSFYFRPSYDYELDDYLLQASRGNPTLASDGSPRPMKWATSRTKRGTSPPGESRCLTLSNPCFTCPMKHL